MAADWVADDTGCLLVVGRGSVLPILTGWPPDLRDKPPWHTDRMRKHSTFVFTYGTRPAGCHGRAA
ncbi:hypothetical protein GCM10010236_01520 [Streptomyces eurythermus]|nr:hypothetical protein GCM10010236_01520 [Streptomyces eurythermus]